MEGALAHRCFIRKLKDAQGHMLDFAPGGEQGYAIRGLGKRDSRQKRLPRHSIANVVEREMYVGFSSGGEKRRAEVNVRFKRSHLKSFGVLFFG